MGLFLGCRFDFTTISYTSKKANVEKVPQFNEQTLLQGMAPETFTETINVHVHCQ